MSHRVTELYRIQQRFVAELTELAHRIAVEKLKEAFGGRAAHGARDGVADVTHSYDGDSDSDPAPYQRASSHQRAKRSPEELEALAGRFAAFVQANPGLRIEQINKQLGTETRDLALPIRKLIADGVIRAKGRKRSTTYFDNQHAQA